jgi:putative addiction module killer protein
MKEIRFYKLENGKAPFQQWISELKDSSAATTINVRVRRLVLGLRGDFKRVGKGVLELRIHHGPGYRVYFAEHGKATIVLLIAGNKSSQKQDIKQAITYWKDYKEKLNEKKRTKNHKRNYWQL